MATTGGSDEEGGLPFMPLWVNAYTTDTREMSAAARGVYMDLLCYQWRKGLMPGHHERLARIANVSLEEFDKLWPEMQLRFVVVADGYLNERVEHERKKSFGLKAQASEKGARGAAMRWHKDAKGNGPGNSRGNARANAPANARAGAQAKPEQWPLSPSLSPSPSESPSPDQPVGGKRPARKCPSDWKPSPEELAKLQSECQGVDLQREAAKMKDHTFGTPRSDWDATFRNWARRAFENLPKNRFEKQGPVTGVRELGK